MPLDALVVGAGPAGSVAALVLARAGARVRLIDRSQFPRDKLCGDTLNPGSLALLERLNSPTAARVRGTALPLTGMLVSGPGGRSVAADYPRAIGGASILRRELDAMLLEAALAAGAEFEPGVRCRGPLLDENGAVFGVRVSSAHEGTEHARITVAADGRHSTLGFALGLTTFPAAPRRWAYGAYFSNVAGMTTRGEMHIRGDGYIGVAPLPGGIANVCVVRSGLDGGLRRQAPADVVKHAIAGDDLLRERFARARRESPVAVLGPLAVDAAGVGRTGLLLAGDAAGFVDPMTGDGLRFALRGGELAAEAALQELESGASAAASLAASRAAEFGAKWRVNRILRSLVRQPAAVRMAATLSAVWPAPVRSLVNFAGDVALATR